MDSNKTIQNAVQQIVDAIMQPSVNGYTPASITIKRNYFRADDIKVAVRFRASK